MMARKKRITIIAIAIILVAITIIGILVFLYLKTDAFKSKETLFAKYLVQNFDSIEILKNTEKSKEEDFLSNNKYTSEIEGKIEYTENQGTSNENRNSSINNVGIKIKSNVDKANNYSYSDVAIGTDNEKLIGLEYLKQKDTLGIRLNGIQQFVSTDENSSDETEIKNIEKLTSEIDIDSILNFTEEEKQNLTKTYLNIIQSNVSKDKYHKQTNKLITINNKDVQTNAYYISLTVEEYNNLYIKLLEQLTKDETILSKVDLIEKQIKEKVSNYNEEKSLREQFVNYINDKIKEIEDNNIGNDEVKITVYENNMKTVRTSIEKSTEKIILDLYDGSSIKIDTTKIEDTTNEQYIKIEKKNDGTQTNTLVEYAKLEDNNIKNKIQLYCKQIYKENELDKTIELGISNEKNEAVLNIENNMKIVNEFDNQIKLDDDNVKLDDLNDDQKNMIKNILNENIQTQLSNLFSVASKDDYTKMLQNIGIMKKSAVQLPSDGQITDVERKRFNSQFEFFASENLTSNNIKELINTAQNNFEDMKVILKDGEVQDLDMEKLNSSKDTYEYQKNISEMLIYIKRNSNNKNKIEDALKYAEVSNNKYTVSIEYDNDGLVKLIRVKKQD